MAIRRAALLMLGLLGSVFLSMLLYISAESILVSRSQEITPTPPVLDVVREQSEIELPYAVPGTMLIAEKLSAYDGPFCEDGTDREVVNIFALHIRNVGTKEVSNAAIFLSTEENGLAFYGEHIPPGATVVLLEITGATFNIGRITACTGSQMIDHGDNAMDKIEVTDRPLGTLIVTNVTDKPLYNLQLFYKSWLSPPGVYVGGISYSVEIALLMPDQTAYLYPNHYASGYSKVVSAKAGK